MIKRRIIYFFKLLLVYTPFIKKIFIFFSLSYPRVVMYHRFNLPFCESTSLDDFQWQLDFLKSNFNVVKLADYVKQDMNFKDIPSPHAIITIDDGYYDFYEFAYPELIQRKIPATFFITTAFVNGELWLWFDQLRFIVDNFQNNQLNFDFNRMEFDLVFGNEIEKSKSWNILADYCLRLSEAEKKKFLMKLSRKSKVDINIVTPDKYASVTWKQVQEMSQKNIEIGAHTINHPVLSELNQDELISELILSKNEIEQKTTQKVTTMAFPFGNSEDYNDNVLMQVINAGYQGAVTAHGGLALPTNKFKLKRIPIPENRVEFLWKICGFEFYLNMMKHFWGGLYKDR